MPKYFCIPNHVTDETFVLEDPLEAARRAALHSPVHTTKDKRREWFLDPKTDSCCLGLTEALNPALRVSTSGGNPAATLHGIVGDYDSTAPGTFADQAQHVRDFYKDSPGLCPQWIQRTFSGHFRLIWEFAEPCSLRGCSELFFPEFTKHFRRLTRASSVLAGLDEGAMSKPSTYYDAQGDWEATNPNPMPAAEVDGVFFSAVRAFSKAKRGTTGFTEIPMEAIKRKLDELFPGRWPSDLPFVDGCRGPAVWDPTATNPTTTIFTTTGAYRFSSAKGYHSYEEILGRDFVRQWTDNKLGQVARHFHYLPAASKYYVKIAEHWEPQGLQDLQRRLVNDWGLSRKAPGTNTVSEVEQATQYIQDHCKIDGLLPFIYDRREVVDMNNRRFLNVSRITVMEPAPEAINQTRAYHHAQPNRKNPYRWGDGFPWIAKWLGSLFDNPRRQLAYLLCWVKQAYEGAREGTPVKGQALFLVGGVGRGKTLFNSNLFMGAILGGSVEAKDYLLGKGDFNKELLEHGYWTIDDGEAAKDAKTHQLFTERVKAFVANPLVTYHPKFVDKQTMHYSGRLCVTLNDDEESLKMIPDLDRNILDKLIILRLSEKTTFEFPNQSEVSKALKWQLPYFLRWLTHWTPPNKITYKATRFGMNPYIDRRVRLSALSAGSDSDINMYLTQLCKNDDEFIELAKKDGTWVGTAADLFGVIKDNPLTRDLSREASPRLLSRKLTAMSALQDSGITKQKTRTKTFKFYIKVKEFSED